MPLQSNIARPYAHALFQLAMEQGNLAVWHNQLQWLSAVADDPQLKDIAANPSVLPDQLVGLIIEISGDKLDQYGRNLVRLIVQNGRLSALAEIAQIYAELRAESEKTVRAAMYTATPLDKSKQDRFASALQHKLGRSVELDFKVDEELIGGAVIRAGDWVVDGSVKTQLARLVGAIGS